MDKETQLKWDAASRTLDFFSFAEDRRLGPHKQRLFANMRGATLMVGAGTGNDFKFFPPNMRVVAIDISDARTRGPKGGLLSGFNRTARDGCLRTRVPRSYL